MISKFLRENVWAAGFLTIIRLYLGWQWAYHGWEKLMADKPFNATGFLTKSIETPVVDKATGELLYPTYTAFLENFALPNVGLINFAIPLGEFLVGVGLLLGCLTTAAMFFGLLMNFMFMFGGTVSSNPWLTLLGFVIIAAGANAGKFGLDYYVLPFLRKFNTVTFHTNGKAKAH